MRSLEFVIYGRARTQGSKKSVPAGKYWRVVDASPYTKQWKGQVSQVAGEAVEEGGWDLARGPVALKVELVFARPKSHLGTGRNAGSLKPSSPRSHTSTPDSLKCTRALEDAMAGIVFLDDSQIVWHDIMKRYAGVGEPEGVHVRVEDWAAEEA